MSCWVTLQVAAEFLQTSVQDVVTRAATGQLRTREENGLLFVAVSPRPAETAVYPIPPTSGLDESPLNFRLARTNVRRTRPAA